MFLLSFDEKFVFLHHIPKGIRHLRLREVKRIYQQNNK